MPKAKKTKKSEKYNVTGEELLNKVKEIIKEGNARSITIKDSKGQTVFKMPVTFGVLGALIAPALIVVGSLAAVLTSCSISVERKSK